MADGLPDFDSMPDQSQPAMPTSFDAMPDESKPAQPANVSWSQVPGEALKNLPSSAGNFASSVAQPFLHPIQTAENIGNIGQGLLQKTGLESGNEYEKYPDAVGKFFADRYGGLDNLKNTLATDPVGFAADVSSVLTGGETALARVPGVVGDVAKAAGTVGRAVNPVSLTAAPIKAAAKLVSPGAADAATLTNAGVELTPGQTAGGIPKTIEDAATSVPIVGSVIQNARRRSVEGFNKAVANQALDEVGDKLSPTTPAGHEMIAEVDQKLGDKYDALLPKLTWTPDAQYGQDLKNIQQHDVAILPKEQADQYQAIIDSRLGPPAPMDGKTLKSVESELSNIASSYSSSADAAQRGLGSALNGTVKAIRSNLERSNPQYAAELSSLNSAWAMYARMRDAASRRTTSDGVFMPSDLLAAVKKGDKTVGKGAFARGDALMQAFAETGQRVLPSALPSSGTSERAALMAGVAGSAWWLHRPEIIAAAAASALPYTQSGRAALRMVGQSGGITNPAFQAGRLNDMQPTFAVPQQKHGGKVEQKNGFASGGTAIRHTAKVVRPLGRKAKDGRYYLPDRNRPGKWLMVVRKA